jgi:hypothetical protein
MRCSDPDHRAAIAIHAPLVGRVAELGRQLRSLRRD